MGHIPKRFICPKCGLTNIVPKSIRKMSVQIRGSIRIRCAGPSLTHKQCPGIVEFKPATTEQVSA